MRSLLNKDKVVRTLLRPDKAIVNLIKPENVEAVFVLGHGNNKHGILSDIAKIRVRQAVKTFKKAKKAKTLITTGGKGFRFNRSQWDHCELLKKYAGALGVKKDKVEAIVFSKNTVDEVLAIKEIIQQRGYKEIAIVTSDFHMGRVYTLSMFANIDITVDYVAAISLPDVLVKEGMRETFRLFPSLAWLLRRMKKPLPEQILPSLLKKEEK